MDCNANICNNPTHYLNLFSFSTSATYSKASPLLIYESKTERCHLSLLFDSCPNILCPPTRPLFVSIKPTMLVA